MPKVIIIIWKGSALLKLLNSEMKISNIKGWLTLVPIKYDFKPCFCNKMNKFNCDNQARRIKMTTTLTSQSLQWGRANSGCGNFVRRVRLDAFPLCNLWSKKTFQLFSKSGLYNWRFHSYRKLFYFAASPTPHELAPRNHCSNGHYSLKYCS